jgi:D-alanyl-D-alanine carboxypeptidase
VTEDVLAAVALAIAIAGGAAAEAVREAVREVTAVATQAAAVADAEDGRVLNQKSTALKGRGFSRDARANKDAGFSP